MLCRLCPSGASMPGSDAAALVGEYLDRVHHADPAGQVRPEEPEKRLVHPALGGAERGVEGAVHDLRRGAAPVDGELVAGDGDRARVLQQHVLPKGRVGEEVDPVGPVGHLADAAPGLGLDVLQRLAQRQDERVPADLVDQGEQPFLDPLRRVQLHLQVLVLQLRLADRVLQEGEQVAADLPAFDDLERAHPDAVVVGGLRAGGHPAGLLGAVLALVDDRGHPGDQLAVVEDRQDHALVGVVDVAVAGVVVDERVTVVHADRRVADPVLVDEAHRVVQHRGEGEHAAGADVDEVAGGGVDGAGEVAPLRARGGAGLRHHLERLVQPGDEPLAYPVQGVRVDRAGQQPLLLGRARRHPVVGHDLRVGPEEQRRLDEEPVDPLLVLGAELLLGQLGHRESPVSSSGTRSRLGRRLPAASRVRPGRWSSGW